MPKATLTFNLPEEQSEFDQVSKAGDLASIIWEFTQEVRSKTKHGTEEDQKIWEPVREAWWNLLNEFHYDPYEN